MFKPIADLSKARILISNDDGLEAAGIKILERIARTLSKDVWVVAPELEQSATSHSLTTRRPLRLRQVSARRFAVDGTPTDSVLLAIHKVLREKKPDLVLSGINRGGNLGEDVTYSGTVAAAMEGTLLGVRSIALSQVFSPRHPVKWGTAEQFAPQVIRALVSQPWKPNILVNVNFPDRVAAQVTGIEVVGQGKRKLGDHIEERKDPRGVPYIWIGAQRDENRTLKGTDIEAVHRGAVTVTPLCLDLTSRAAIKTMKALFR